MYKFLNNYQSELSVGVSESDTTITVNAAPSITLGVGDVCRLTIQNDDATLFEIVDVTAISGNTITVTRGVEGSVAQVWDADEMIICSITSEQINKINQIGIDNVESWFISTTPNLNDSNGHKQKYSATASGTLTFTIKNNGYIDLLLNPSTFTLTWQDVTFKNGAASQISASKENRVLIESVSGVLYGYIVSN